MHDAFNAFSILWSFFPSFFAFSILGVEICVFLKYMTAFDRCFLHHPYQLVVNWRFVQWVRWYGLVVGNAQRGNFAWSFGMESHLFSLATFPRYQCEFCLNLQIVTWHLMYCMLFPSFSNSKTHNITISCYWRTITWATKTWLIKIKQHTFASNTPSWIRIPMARQGLAASPTVIILYHFEIFWIILTCLGVIIAGIYILVLNRNMY